MRAAVWHRVSKDDQTSAGQRLDIEEYCRRANLEVVIDYDIDGSAWRGKQKPALEDLLARVHRKEVDVVVVWALDRLDRSSPAGCWLYFDRIHKAGAKFVSLQDPWATTLGKDEAMDPTVSLLLMQSGWFAWWYSQRASDRIRAGLAAKKAAGQKIGRPQGAKDLKQRNRSGYYERWERDREDKKRGSKKTSGGNGGSNPSGS